MAGEPDPDHLQADPVAQGHGDGRQGNGKPGTAIHHLVEVTVAGVVVVALVAAKAKVVEQEAREGPDLGGQGTGEPGANLVGQGIEFTEVGLDVQVWVFVPCQFQGQLGQVERCGWLARQHGEGCLKIHTTIIGRKEVRRTSLAEPI